MPAMRSPQDLMMMELKEIYSAEKQLMRALPKLQKQVTSQRLRQMLDRRREQGMETLEHLDEIFDEMQTRKGRVKNLAAEGLLEDMLQHLDEIEDEAMLDAVLLASMQKLEHYCIAAWGTVASMGRLMGQRSAVNAMERLLAEGKRFDGELTTLAEREINPAMMQGNDDSGERGRGRSGGQSQRGRNARQRQPAS